MNYLKKNDKKMYIKNIVYNKKIKYNYFINETIEAGLILKGWEVKSIRSFKVSIENSYISIKNKEAYLVGSNIVPLNKYSNGVLNNPKRIRKLLLNSFEINNLFKKMNNKGYTLIVVSIYWKNEWCKIKIALAKGKKKFDKRFDIKNKEWCIKKNRILKKNILC